VAAGQLLDWSRIDTVLLDMDGTLLDLNFDNHFWQVHLPQRYAAARGVSLEVGREELMARYHARAGTLDWYSVDFWETALELDIMQLKQEVAHLIDIHPHVTDFLAAVRATGRRIVLATNAHHKSVTLKMANRNSGVACANSNPSIRRARCWSTTACRCSTARAASASRSWFR